MLRFRGFGLSTGTGNGIGDDRLLPELGLDVGDDGVLHLGVDGLDLDVGVDGRDRGSTRDDSFLLAALPGRLAGADFAVRQGKISMRMADPFSE